LPRLSIPAVLSFMSGSVILSSRSCLQAYPVLADLSGRPVQNDPAGRSCSAYPVPTDLSWLSCHGHPVSVVRSCHVLAVLSSLSCQGCPPQFSPPNVLSSCSCPSTSSSALLSCPCCQVLTALSIFRLSCPGQPILASMSPLPLSLCSVQADLSGQYVQP
jgi:hypothetical protein